MKAAVLLVLEWVAVGVLALVGADALRLGTSGDVALASGLAMFGAIVARDLNARRNAGAGWDRAIRMMGGARE